MTFPNPHATVETPERLLLGELIARSDRILSLLESPRQEAADAGPDVRLELIALHTAIGDAIETLERHQCPH